MDGFLGHFGGVLGCNTHEAFMVPWLTVGVSNKLQMARNLTGGVPVVYLGRLANLGPFRECLTPAHEKRQKGAPEDIGVPDCKTDNADCKTDNGENARMHEKNTYAKWDAHDDMAKYNTQANEKATTANNWRTPGASNPGRYTRRPHSNEGARKCCVGLSAARLGAKQTGGWSE